MRLFEIEEYTNVNPKGKHNKEYEACARRASYLAIVCANWLHYCGGNPQKARDNEPFHDIPESWIGAARFKKARKRSGYWDRSGYGPKAPTLKWKEGAGWRRANRRLDDQESIPVAKPNASAKSLWRDVFDHWLDGGLGRSVEALLLMLPEENRGRVKDELDKF